MREIHDTVDPEEPRKRLSYTPPRAVFGVTPKYTWYVVLPPVAVSATIITCSVVVSKTSAKSAKQAARNEDD
jgi:hypothetical protein